MRTINFFILFLFYVTLYSCKSLYTVIKPENINSSIRLSDYLIYTRYDTLYNDQQQITSAIAKGNQILAVHYLLIEKTAHYPKRAYHITPFPMYHMYSRDILRNGMIPEYNMEHFSSGQKVDFKYMLEIHEGSLTQTDRLDFNQADDTKSISWNITYSRDSLGIYLNKLTSRSFSKDKKPFTLSLDTVLNRIPYYSKVNKPIFGLSYIDQSVCVNNVLFYPVDSVYFANGKPDKRKDVYLRFIEDNEIKYLRYRSRFQQNIKN